MSASPMTTEQLAAFVCRVSQDDFPAEARERLKHNILDTIGCAIGAIDGAPPRQLLALIDELGGNPQSTLIGGGQTSVDRAALYNGALVRYLDFMDNFAAKNEVCHPSDNFAGLLAVANYVGSSGEELLLALAIAYQVQCRLIEELPTMRAGLNYTTPLAFSVAAGAARLLGLNAGQTANALALSGVDSISLAVIQAEPVAQWKGLASADVAMRSVHNTLLARAGITGPLGVFDGPHGLYQLVKSKAGIDWSTEKLDVVPRTSIKKYNGEFQSQTAVDTVLALRQAHGLGDTDVAEIVVEVPSGAYEVIGGGEYGPKDECHNKEQADHNLRYMVAVALLDGELWPPQYATERISRADVQALLPKVTIKSKLTFGWRIPEEQPAHVTITYTDDREFQKEQAMYPGFFALPMSWEQVVEKFNRLTTPYADAALQSSIVAAVANLEQVSVRELMELLSKVRT